MKTTFNIPKRNNANSGQKAHNDNRYYKAGRIRMGSWITQKLPAADILISERELVHITNRHSNELHDLGMTSKSYIEMIVHQVNEIRRDSEAYLFIVAGERTSNKDTEQCAVVELKIEWMNRKKVYIIKSARPMTWGRLKKIELVCVKPRS